MSVSEGSGPLGLDDEHSTSGPTTQTTTSSPGDLYDDAPPPAAGRFIAWVGRTQDEPTTAHNAQIVYPWIQGALAAVTWIANRWRRRALRDKIPTGAAPSIWIPTEQEAAGIVGPISRIIGRHSPMLPELPASDFSDAVELASTGVEYRGRNALGELAINEGIDPDTGHPWAIEPAAVS